MYVTSKSGDSCYRCTLRSCKEKININACGMIREGPAPHEHNDTVSDMKFEFLRANCVLSGSERLDTLPSAILRHFTAPGFYIILRHPEFI